jgi:hypothetical protein
MQKQRDPEPAAAPFRRERFAWRPRLAKPFDEETRSGDRLDVGLEWAMRLRTPSRARRERGRRRSVAVVRVLPRGRLLGDQAHDGVSGATQRHEALLAPRFARQAPVAAALMQDGRVRSREQAAPDLVVRRCLRHAGACNAGARRVSRRRRSESNRWGRTDGASRARTGDLVAASHALSQLSYGPNRALSLASNSKSSAQLIPVRWLFRLAATRRRSSGCPSKRSGRIKKQRSRSGQYAAMTSTSAGV